MEYIRVDRNKKRYLDLLLLADEKEEMIDLYLDRGTMYVLDEQGPKAVCVVTDEGSGVLELKNLAVAPSFQRKGYGRRMVRFLAETYAGQYTLFQVGTGDSPATVPFYEACGFVRSHVIKNFFTDHYDFPIWEGGVLLRDMVYLRMNLSSLKNDPPNAILYPTQNKEVLSMDIYELIRSRRTIRKFRQELLSPEQLTRFVDAARMAPSGGNLQPLKYFCIHTPQMAAKVFPLVKWAGYLAPDYNPAEGERPTAYVVVCADTTVRPAGNETDTGAAVENLILAAWAEGVGSCWIGSVDRNSMSALLNLSPELKVMCVVALGYPAETPRETGIADGSIKYYLDETGTLNVPKRGMNDVLLDIV